MSQYTITEIAAQTPGSTPDADDLMLADKTTTNKTVAYTLSALKAFFRPAVATASESGLITSAEKEKIGKTNADATKNQSDSYLTNRGNHSGTQPISSVSGLNDALNGMATGLNGVATRTSALETTVAGLNGGASVIKSGLTFSASTATHVIISAGVISVFDKTLGTMKDVNVAGISTNVNTLSGWQTTFYVNDSGSIVTTKTALPIVTAYHPNDEIVTTTAGEKVFDSPVGNIKVYTDSADFPSATKYPGSMIVYSNGTGFDLLFSSADKWLKQDGTEL